MKFFNVFFLAALYFSPLQAAPLKVGVTAGPHAIIMEKVKEIAKEKGLEIQIVEFNDFILPNMALNDKEIDLNSYQHEPFLDEQVKARGYNIKAAGKTVLMPLGIYSKRIKDLNELKDKAKVSIPSDPTNEGRALKLFEKQGIITLSSSENPSILDIKDNPKNITFLEIDAPQLPRTLDDVDAAVINTDWVLLAGMDPKSALVMEDKDSPYANIFAIRKDETRPEVFEIISLYQSEPIKDFILKHFKGAVIPVW